VTSADLDALLQRVGDGDTLSADEVSRLDGDVDILPLGMLADACRRRLHDGDVTFVRVSHCTIGEAVTVEPEAREIRLTGTPASLEAAVAGVSAARAAAGSRAVSGFSSDDLLQLARDSDGGLAHVCRTLRAAGLDAVARVVIDGGEAIPEVVGELVAAGFPDVRLGVAHVTGAGRTALFVAAAALQDRFGCVRLLDPLPPTGRGSSPTTGYDDVKAVAVARLVAPNIPIVQVDWLRYGPKLAQVALTFGADDLDGVSASDAAPDGRRRAPLEEVRRNIEAAGFHPVERDGRFTRVG